LLCPSKWVRVTENVGHGDPDYGEMDKEDALLCNEMAISFINYFYRKTIT